jgi:hypothetical protein
MAGRARHTTVSAFYMPLILCALRRSGVTAIDHELGGWGSETYWISRIPRFIAFVDALRAASHRLSSQAANFYSTLGTRCLCMLTTRTIVRVRFLFVCMAFRFRTGLSVLFCICARTILQSVVSCQCSYRAGHR